MKTIRFLETRQRQRAGREDVFEKGKTYEVTDDVADHYIRREVAVEVATKGPKASKEEKLKTDKADGTKGEAQTNGNAVDSTADVGRQDGGDSGQRPEPAGKPAGAGSKARKAAKKAGKRS